MATALLLFLLLGCGKSAPTRVEVSGNVSLDDKALADGIVDFFSVDGRPPIEANVENGQFHLRAPAGHYRVEIRCFRERIPRPEPPNDPRINFLPAEYNAESILTAEVTRDAPNNLTFNLKSNGKSGPGAP